MRTLRPGDQPERELDAQLGGAGQPLLAAQTGEKRLLLFIDQMEELFARCPRPVQQQFLARLQALRSDPRCVLILALRADFFPDLMSSMLWPIDPAQRLEVAPLRGAALAAAIAGPAAQVGVRLEPTLLERLVADAAEEPGALPLLQEALVLLWERRENRRLTLAAYEQLGRQAGGGEGPPRSGLAVAIASHAEAVFARLAKNPEQQRLARRIFVRLVHFGEGRPNTRRQLPRSALRAHGDDPALFSATLELLASQRLLTQSSDDAAPAAAGEDAVRVDLSHEVILRAWPRLMRWIAEKKQAERIRRRLEDQASERLRLRKQGYGLLDAAETKEAEDWLAGPDAKDVGVSAAVAELIHDSRKAIHWEAAQAQRRWQLTAVVLLLIAGIAAGAALLAYQESNRVLLQYRLANEARQQALAKARTATARSLSALSRERLGRDADYDQALLLAVFGHRLQPSADSESSLLAALDGAPGLLTQLHGPDGRVGCLAVSPDGQLLATGGTDGLVQLFDARRGQPLGEVPLCGEDVFGKLHAAGPANPVDLGHDLAEQGSRVGMIADRSERAARGRGHAGQRGEEDELRPDLAPDVIGLRRLESRLAQGEAQVVQPARGRAVAEPEQEAGELAALLDHAGFAERHRDIGHAVGNLDVGQVLDQPRRHPRAEPATRPTRRRGSRPGAT